VSRRQVLGGGLAGAAGLVVAGVGAPGCGPAPAPDAGAAPSGARPPQPGSPRTLTVDGLEAPIGLGLNDVYFGWHVDDHRRGAIQRAYRVVVARG
jgi:hypothetical protein